jgi:alanyl-tRNA synthetase
MKADELREKYLSFFVSKGHARRASDVLVPTWDPSVLFTPAGMNQFKDHFLGKVKLDFTRATTCQKCLRTGDIDNVGRTAYHHTFFEMLGNFSFGDYFKRDAIRWAWEFLTDKKWLGLDPARLSVTVYKDDEEAAKIWIEQVKLPANRIQWLNEDENFWPASAPSQGPDGVCGPCSEIYYHPAAGGEVEIWNLVFTQFNRVGEPPDNLRPLPSKNIDTGMGLERTAAVLQGVDTNYHIDSLLPIVQAAAEVCGIKYESQSENGRRLRRITDHLRACAFAIHENVYPGPQKEKYVIKRLLRRAVLDGHQMGQHEPFLYELVPAVVAAMQQPYPELKETADRVAQAIQKEEANFFSTIDAGLERIERVFQSMESSQRVMVDGSEAAELYQTYGVPPELFQTLAAERNFTFDWEGFETQMRKHEEVSGKKTWELFKHGPIESLKEALHYTEFLGYDATEAKATIKGIVAGCPPEDHLCDKIAEVGHEQTIRVVLDRTPFYGESGGQVGDVGKLVGDGFEFDVIDTKKDGDLFIHVGHLKRGEMIEGAEVTATVDTSRRDAIRRAHSATHILHYALQKQLGPHAQQQGSKVEPDYLRFDFSNQSPVGRAELAAIEADVVQRVVATEPIVWQTLPLAEAREKGAMMLFGEKYPDPVRMVSMGEFSRELCGGTHLSNTGDIAAFEIVSEEGVSAGTRRIVALTGTRAKEHTAQAKSVLEETKSLLAVSADQTHDAVKCLMQHVRDLRKQLAGGGATPAAAALPAAAAVAKPSDAQVKEILSEVARTLNVAAFDVPARIAALLDEVKEIERQLAARASAGVVSAASLLERAEEVSGVSVVVAEIPASTSNLLRQLIDQVRQRAQPVAVLLATVEGEDKVTVVAAVSKELTSRGVHAGNWVKHVAQLLGGSGGGKPDMAQAGGKQPENLPTALESAKQFLVGELK